MLIPAEEEQIETKFVARVNEEDPFYIEIDQVRRRIGVHIAASPIRTNFMRRWISDNDGNRKAQHRKRRTNRSCL